jgi:hypothetical protein
MCERVSRHPWRRRGLPAAADWHRAAGSPVECGGADAAQHSRSGVRRLRVGPLSANSAMDLAPISGC